MSSHPPTAAVIGWPIAHSRSPLVHRYWLARYGIDGLYERIAVPPAGIDRFLATFQNHGLVGANVTVPHKEAALRYARADDTARAIGAVNTLWLEDGVLHGTNSDCEGFLANLDQETPGWADGRPVALVIGAGGAARAVLHGLRARGFRSIFLANRTAARAEALARDFPGVEPVPWEERSAFVPRAGLLVNTSVLGMKGEPALDLALDGAAADTVVSDIVYVPLETPLMAAARAQGLRVAGGLGMLLHQAAVGFERWFGVRPAVDDGLYAEIAGDLEGEGEAGR